MSQTQIATFAALEAQTSFLESRKAYLSAGEDLATAEFWAKEDSRVIYARTHRALVSGELVVAA